MVLLFLSFKYNLKRVLCTLLVLTWYFIFESQATGMQCIAV